MGIDAVSTARVLVYLAQKRNHFHIYIYGNRLCPSLAPLPLLIVNPLLPEKDYMID